MDRREFMGRLDNLLADIPQQEREDAITYYEGYFDDAGPENEGMVIRELGSPEKVAAIIKADLLASGSEYSPKSDRESPGDESKSGGKTGDASKNNETSGHGSQRKDKTDGGRGADRGYGSDKDGMGDAWEGEKIYGNYTDSGYEDSRFDSRQMPDVSGRDGRRQKGRGWSGRMTLLLLLVIFASPVWGGALGLIGGLFGGIVGVFGAGVGLLIGGFVLLIVGLTNMVSSLSLGLALFGTGMVLLAIGILCMMGFAWIAFTACPKIFRWGTGFVHEIIDKVKGEDRK